MKLIITGIALVVFVQAMVKQFVETDSVQVMKPMKHVHQIEMQHVNVILVKYSTVTVAMNAGPKAGLLMDFLIAKINSMVLI